MNSSFPWFGAGRLWLDSRPRCVHEFMAVRKKFVLPAALTGAVFRIMADSDFIAYLDGIEIGRGQFSDDPDAPTYTDVLPGELAAGEHLLALNIYHRGRNCAIYAAGLPGTVFVLESRGKAVLVSDESCLVAPTPGFRGGEMPLLTPQLGFTMQFDARLDAADWRLPDYDDSAWRKPFVAAERRIAAPRPAAARPVLEEYCAGTRVKSGLVRRYGEKESFALTMAADHVFWDHHPQTGELTRLPKVSSGWSLIYDLGEEKVGFVEFELEAPAGTIVDFAHGEHLDDGHVRMECFGRNFADRYICRGRRDRFQLPFRRIGGRYLEFHVIPPADCDRLRFRTAGIAPWTLRLPEPATFETADARLTGVRGLAVRTLECCMHEHYEDCPWREQALYTYDSRNQMLYGYYVWGNYDFAAASLNLIGSGLREDGYLRLCHPTRMSLTIPVFSMIWPLAIYEHMLYSGDGSVWRRNRKTVYRMYEKLSAVRDAATALYQALDPDFWNFYEWTPGLSNVPMTRDDVHALYNLYFANMLEAVGKLEAWDGDAGRAAAFLTEAGRIRRTVEKLFYVEGEDCYASFLHGGKPTADRHEHVQLMMLYAGAVPAARLPGVLKRLLAEDGSLVPVTLSPMPYLAEAVFKFDYGAGARQFLRRKLENSYYPMLDGHSTTLWETVRGGEDFVYAGSLCHGWSSLPTYYCGAGLLGAAPLEPGFRRFRVRPWADGRGGAEGEIPTPVGMIRIAWRKNDRGKYDLSIAHPASLTPVVEEFGDTPLGEVVRNPF